MELVYSLCNLCDLSFAILDSCLVMSLCPQVTVTDKSPSRHANNTSHFWCDKWQLIFIVEVCEIG